jgi:hypothetical protein
MLDRQSILIAGASRGVGREIAKILTAKGKSVIALLRTAETQSELEALGARVLMGDALDAEAVRTAIATDPSIGTIISTIGGVPQDGQRADYLGNKQLIDFEIYLDFFVGIWCDKRCHSAPSLSNTGHSFGRKRTRRKSSHREWIDVYDRPSWWFKIGTCYG